jgi:hypothetical protein
MKKAGQVYEYPARNFPSIRVMPQEFYTFTGKPSHMVPRKTDPKGDRPTSSRKRSGPGQDRLRDIEDRRHHGLKRGAPHAPHKPQKKPKLSPDHATHTRLAADELGPHLNPPSPIKPSKKITRTGSKK